MRASASDFRVHLKDHLNQIAEGGIAVIIERNGFNMAVVIGLDEYRAFLRWKREKSGSVMVPEEHPDDLPVEEVERIYNATARLTDEATTWWRQRAAVSLCLRTGRAPGAGPPS
jgi:hypothetical protein